MHRLSIRQGWLAALALVPLLACTPTAEESATAEMGAPAEELSPREALIARGEELELPTEWVPPPGDPIVHHTSGFAKTLCSAVFITGLDPADAAENVGYFTSPYDERAVVTDTVVDYDTQTVSLTLPSGVVRTAHRYGSQGCITRNVGEDSIHFAPTVVEPMTPDPATTPWPMGDVLPDEPFPSGIDMDLVQQAVDIAMDQEGMTLGFVVTHDGRIIGEGYGPGVDMHTPFESWSMGKSLTGTLMAVLIQQGVYELDQPAPIPQWQGDERRSIRIMDIMRMSSGIRIVAPQDPDYEPEMGYPDHLYLYTGPNAFEWAATRPQQWMPNTVGRYRNTDPALTNYLIRLGVEGRGDDYHAFPQRALFDRLGIRNMVMETDPQGNFLTQGYELGSARDWARLGNLYLQDGVWEGERILPEGYVDYAMTVAPAWIADDRPIYGGGFLWKDLGFPIEDDYGAFAGAGGQYTIIIPSRGLVIARLGKYAGAGPGGRNLNRAIELILEAVPAR
ncbi:MAG: serine hydrolase [Gemmatimonadota bacterium]|nr:serine hydrolase [Gemmatimonadota bacterium]